MVDANTAAAESAAGAVMELAALAAGMPSSARYTQSAASGTAELLTAAMTQCQLQFQQMLLAHTAGTADVRALDDEAGSFLSDLLNTGAFVVLLSSHNFVEI